MTKIPRHKTGTKRHKIDDHASRFIHSEKSSHLAATAQLCERRRHEVSLDEVERICAYVGGQPMYGVADFETGIFLPTIFCAKVAFASCDREGPTMTR